MNKEIKKELMLIVSATGFLSVYASENDKPIDHPVYPLIKDLTKILFLYKSKYKDLLQECFDLFDEITTDDEYTIDTIAFSNSILVFHQQLSNKKFHPNYSKIQHFWMVYKKHHRAHSVETKEDRKRINETYANSRYIARKFYDKLQEM